MTNSTRPNKEKQMLENYFLVATCWNDHKAAVRNKMSSEKAIKLLGEAETSKSSSLRKRAAKLLDIIIYDQDEPEYLQGKS